jgi:hypothetical protein
VGAAPDRPEEKPPVEFVSWNAGFGWVKYHVTPDRQAARTFCGREIPRNARLTYTPPPGGDFFKAVCLDCLKAYSTNYEEGPHDHASVD